MNKLESQWASVKMNRWERVSRTILRGWFWNLVPAIMLSVSANIWNIVCEKVQEDRHNAEVSPIVKKLSPGIYSVEDISCGTGVLSQYFCDTTYTTLKNGQITDRVNFSNQDGLLLVWGISIISFLAFLISLSVPYNKWREKFQRDLYDKVKDQGSPEEIERIRSLLNMKSDPEKYVKLVQDMNDTRINGELEVRLNPEADLIFIRRIERDTWWIVWKDTKNGHIYHEPIKLSSVGMVLYILWEL